MLFCLTVRFVNYNKNDDGDKEEEEDKSNDDVISVRNECYHSDEVFLFISSLYCWRNYYISYPYESDYCFCYNDDTYSGNNNDNDINDKDNSNYNHYSYC